MTINQEHFTTYKSLSPVLRTQTTSDNVCEDCALVVYSA
jgi:hypothetical protein